MNDDDVELDLEPFDPDLVAERERRLVESVRGLRNPALNAPDPDDIAGLPVIPFGGARNG